MLLRGQPRARLILVVRFWSRGKHNRSRRGHVTAYRAVCGALAALVVTFFNREFRIGIFNNIFICFHY